MYIVTGRGLMQIRLVAGSYPRCRIWDSTQYYREKR